jgi:hypothetical protein
MIAVAIGLGIFVFLLVASFTDEIVFHTKGVGAFPGLVAGIWAAWPFFHHARVDRYNFLHPVPKEYKAPVPQAFAKVRDLLAELSYNFGDKWHVVTADPQSKRITANLRFIDKETKLDLDARGGVHTKEERLQRFLELEVQMKDTGRDSTIVQLDFHPKVEGVNFAACDSIVSGLCNAVEASVGPGTEAGSAADKKLPAPPWWLVGITVLAVLSFLGDVGKRMSGAMDHISTNPQKLDSEKKGRVDQLKQTQDELDAWQKFKEANNLR